MKSITDYMRVFLIISDIFIVRFRGCLGVWLWLPFKVFFTQKSVPTIFFYYLKIIFKISILK
jgi:hypothetical protein